MAKAKDTTVSGGKKLLIYHYEEAWWHLIEQIFDAFHMSDPLMSLFPPARSPHAGPFRYTQGDDALDQRPGLVTYVGSGEADLREGDVDGHTAFICDFATKRVQNMAAQTFAVMDEVTDFLDQSVDAEGRPFMDVFLLAVEKIALRFVGDEGQDVTFVGHQQATPGKCLYVALPGHIVVFMHPDTLIKKVPRGHWTMEHQRKFDEIVARQRAEQHAKKRTRRLS